MKTAFTLIACAACSLAGADSAPQQRWDLGAASRYDYTDIDPVRQRLFLTRGDHVQVLDLATGKQQGEIAATRGVHGVAFAQDLKLGFTSNGGANSVTVFELDTLKVRKEVPVSGQNPDAILYEPVSHKLYTFNGKSKDVSVLDAASMTAVATIKVGGKPEFAVADGAGRIFVNIEDKADLVVIDVASNSVSATWHLAGCEEPTGLAYDARHARLFSVCQNRKMIVTDATSGRQVAQLTIGEHPDAVVFDPASATVYSSNGAGTISVIGQSDADHYQVKATLTTAKGARTMAMDYAGGRIYLPFVADQQFNVVVVKP